METNKIPHRTVGQAGMRQKQNPTSPSYKSVYWKVIDGRQTFPRSSCEKCVERATHNMTFITTLRQHVFWFPCDASRLDARVSEAAVVRLWGCCCLTDRRRCVSAVGPPLGALSKKCFAAAYTLHVHILKVLFPALWESEGWGENAFRSEFHVNTAVNHIFWGKGERNKCIKEFFF